MPIDFIKLNDPVFKEAAIREREAEYALREAKDREVDQMLDRCGAVMDSLPARERSFVRSCQLQRYSHRLLTEPQEKWLRDICERHAPTVDASPAPDDSPSPGM